MFAWSRHCFCSILEIRIFRLSEVNSFLQHQELVSTRLRIAVRPARYPCFGLSHYPLLLFLDTPSHVFPFVMDYQAAQHECKMGGLHMRGWLLVLWFWAVQYPSNGGAGPGKAHSLKVRWMHSTVFSRTKKSLNLSGHQVSRPIRLKQSNGWLPQFWASEGRSLYESLLQMMAYSVVSYYYSNKSWGDDQIKMLSQIHRGK